MDTDEVRMRAAAACPIRTIPFNSVQLRNSRCSAAQPAVTWDGVFVKSRFLLLLLFFSYCGKGVEAIYYTGTKFFYGDTR